MRFANRSLLSAIVVAATMFAAGAAFAAPQGVDPVSYVSAAGPYNAKGQLGASAGRIYMNHNQLLVRITGCEYGARVTNTYNAWNDGYCDDSTGNPRHWTGSGMSFIESIVNDKLLNATTTITGLIAAGKAYNWTPTQYTAAYGGPGSAGSEYLFRNYVDLLVKRLLDADTLTALDYDPNTFRYVDHFNHSTTAPAIGTLSGSVATPTTKDVNGDGREGGWEPEPLLSGTCLPIPIMGDVCLNMYITNIDQRIPFYNNGTTYAGAVSTIADGVSVANVGGPMVSFTPYSPSNQFNTSHLFLAGQPKREFSFDAQINGCNSAELLTALGTCNPNPYRDDDDGLYAEIKLVNFTLDTLFEPPFTTTALGNTNAVTGPYGVGTAAGGRKNATWNVSDVTDGTGYVRQVCPDGTVNVEATVPATEYDPACDLSTYLKVTGTVTVPYLTLGLSLRVVSAYGAAGQSNEPQGVTVFTKAVVTGSTMILGFEVQEINIGTQFYYNLNPGPYCTGFSRGQDLTSIFYDQTDNPNNCNVVRDGTPSVLDDWTRDISERFAATVTFARGEFLGEFEDFFDPATNPGFFLGPTQLFNINSDLLNDLSFDNPLAATDNVPPEATTDYVWLQLSLDSNVDQATLVAGGAVSAPGASTAYERFNVAGNTIRGDAQNEFWADPWGVLMPFNSGLGIFWSSNTTDVVGGSLYKMTSCVTAESYYTGYVDGYEQTSLLDDPSVSRPLPNMGINFSGSGADAVTFPTASTLAIAAGEAGPEYDSMLLHLRIPDVSGSAPFTSATYLKNFVDTNTNSRGKFVPKFMNPARQETYAIGMAIHQNFLSKALYEAVIDGLLCIDIDPVRNSAIWGPNGELFDVTDLLTTDTLGFFVPYLSDKFPGAKLALRILPLLRNPVGKGYAVSAANYPSKISMYTRNFTDTGLPAEVTAQNPIPRIITGGSNQYDSRLKRFRGQIATPTLLRNTCGSGLPVTSPDPLSNPTCGVWPDLSVIIPHLLMEFVVIDDSVSPWQRRRAFALDVGLNIGLNIDIVQDISATGGAQNPLLGDGGFPTASRPVYTGTNFPIGCGAGPAGAFPCEVTGVPSRLVLFLGGIADPELNAILVYDEMASVVTDYTSAISPSTRTTCADPLGVNATCSSTNFSSYENAISNLIGLLLSGEISAFVEIGLDPAALLNIPVILTIPYIGPSFVWNSTSDNTASAGVVGASPTAINDTIDCTNAGFGNACPDPIFGDDQDASPVSRDVSDGDANGFGDYLVVALGLDLSYLESTFLIKLIDSFVEPILYDHCDGEDSDAVAITNIGCVSEAFDNPFGDLLGGLAPGFESEPAYLPRGYVSPETFIKGIEKVHATETIINYEGWHPTANVADLSFSYRVDGGFWTPFVPATTARIPGLFEGRHVFEVRAKDARGNVEMTTERLEFVVDSVAPRVTLVGDRVQRGTVSFLVDSYDAQTLPEDVRVSWKLDDGEWSAYSYQKEVAFGAESGQHVLVVRAMDEAGNVGESVLTIGVEDGGFGCAVAPSAGNKGALDLAIILLVPAMIFLRRKRSV